MQLSEIKPGKLLELTSRSNVTSPLEDASAIDRPILKMMDSREKDLYEEWLDSYGGNLADSCDSDSGSLSNACSY